MKFKFKTQPYQQEAVENICKVFDGQPYMDMVRYTRDLGIKKTSNIVQTSIFDYYEKDDNGFENAKILLNEYQILENIKEIQKANNYKISNALDSGFGRCSLDIEMETGTGKTYVYIKSIFELNKIYGWSKFIIVVPSIAIREGVKKSFEMMEEHFMDEYGKKARYFIYNSKKLIELDNFASSSDIQVMIINAQAFNAKGQDARRIGKELDEFQSRKPIDVVARTRPILIIDEPQKLGGGATQNSLKKFNALFNMNFSATHKKQHNLVYCLDALDAYNKSLVKKIQVKGCEVKNLRGTNSYLYLQEIVLSTTKPPMAKLELEINYNKSINRETRNLGIGEDLYKWSKGMEQYKNGYIISDINKQTNTITFLNGNVLHVGEVVGDDTEKNLRRLQIRETIASHFSKEEILFSKGIKCLSLFFLDEVANYRDYSRYDEKGDYARIFEEEYKNILNDYLNNFETPYIKYLKNIRVEDTHKGYFSIDKKTGHIINSDDKKETGSEDISAYDLILKNKERLLSFEEPTRFIFSHSALREGWDNPNVFQICTLKPGGDSAIAKRQEVGRGLRIAVNKLGDRVDLDYCKDRSTFLKINQLTIVATDSYKDFVADIQKDIKINLADRPTKATVDFFINKRITNGKDELILNNEKAVDIRGNLKLFGYINDDSFLTQKYYEDKTNNNLKELIGDYATYTDSIYKLLQGIFDSKALEDMIGDDRKSKYKENPLNNNFKKKEFETLWNQINHKYAYMVNFDSEELIAKSIDAIDEKLYVAELKGIVTTGEQIMYIDESKLNNGNSFNAGTSKTEFFKGSNGNYIKYDLIGKIKDGTTLTRKTIVKILQGIKPNTFDKFKKNPEDFISKTIKLINEQKATMVVDYITYNIAEGKYDNDIFTANQINIEYDKAFKANRAIQDYIVTDGYADKSVERKFAEDLDNANEVCVYAKLPKRFTIPTPVGDYTPDWAIAFNEGSVKHIYFVAETKGSMESMNIRKIEETKIACAKKLFNNLKLCGNTRYDVVDSYQELLNILCNN